MIVQYCAVIVLFSFDLIRSINKLDLSVHTIAGTGEITVVFRYVNRCPQACNHIISITVYEIDDFLDAFFIEFLQSVA